MALSLAAWPAQAALQLCNQTSYVIYAATAVQQSAQILTRGWTRVVPGGCANAIAEPLKGSSYFVYARSAHAQGAPPRVWGGQFQFCVLGGDFSLRTQAASSGCGSSEAVQVPFAPVATAGAQSWMMTLTEAPALASPDAARDAGLRRLLGDTGYAPAPGPKGLGDALTKFRTSAKLPANASTDALFTALEAEAAKAPALEGYSICNDGDTEIWAALGLKVGADFVSRGWWNVAAGHCAMAIGTALGHDAVYLFASKQGNNHLVSGPMTFCVSNTQFDIRGRDRCAARGLSVSGFLATNAKGLPGFTARIGKNGLVQP
jgi:uncharacterized membrane protein